MHLSINFLFIITQTFAFIVFGKMWIKVFRKGEDAAVSSEWKERITFNFIKHLWAVLVPLGFYRKTKDFSNKRAKRKSNGITIMLHLLCW